MPTVPRGPAAPDMPVPSETDLMMALATMKELGRFKDRLDPSLQGQIEDRRSEGPSGARDEDLPAIAEGARDVAGDRLAAGVRHKAANDPIMREVQKMKRKHEFESASTGVSGGSR